MTIDRHKMGDQHEAWLVANLGGRRTKASGSQFNNPMDGRHNRYMSNYAFAWDGKSTMANSMSIPRTMLDKAKIQADGERPMIAMRFYDDERLKSWEDWALIKMDDFIEMKEKLEEFNLPGDAF